MKEPRIYLDYNASAPLRIEARRAMEAVLDGGPSNASSVHGDGQRGRKAVEEAREQVAAAIGGRPKEIIFTSSATESNNLAIVGSVWAAGADAGDLIASTTVEHPSVLGPLEWLEKDRGLAIARIPVGPSGELDREAFSAALCRRPLLLSMIGANNETGVVQDVIELCQEAKAAGAIVHLDAAQWIGRLPFSVHKIPVDLVTLSSHKLGGPQGAGALWVRGGTKLEANIRGGHQERNRRAGTENVAAIAGFGEACAAACREMAGQGPRIHALRERLWQGLRERCSPVVLNGEGAKRLPNTLNISFGQVDGETLLIALDLMGISVSSGSACTAGSLEPSHVLNAMGIDEDNARAAVRFSLGYGTTSDEIERTITAVTEAVHRIRSEAG